MCCESFTANGTAMLAPTLFAHGTKEQLQRVLPKMASGEEIWAQAWSEPEAGSDLASLRTRAVRDGDHFVVNGQKVWTSLAQYCQWGLATVRTDPDAPKHAGVTMMAIDMKAPGVTVNPLKGLTGNAHFNEVFFDDVFVPDEMVVGKVNDGWRLARAPSARSVPRTGD